jgi:hypothetical protein
MSIKARTPGANHAGDQRVVDVRKIINEQSSVDFLELSKEDVRLLLHIRAIGFGSVHVTVVQGRPAKAVRTEESLDYTKPITFE